MNRINQRHWVSAGVLALGVAFGIGEAQAAWEQVGQTIIASEGAENGVVAVDLDGDGRDDFVSLGSQALFVGGCETSGVCAIKQSLVIDAFVFPRLMVRRGVDRPTLVVASYYGVVEYAGWPLREIRRTPLGYALDSVIADVDADGSDELIVCGSALTAYDFDSMIAKWTIPTPGVNMAVAQLDADAPLELIFGGDHTTVLDGASLQLEWTASEIFSRLVTPGRWGPQQLPGFVGHRGASDLIAYLPPPHLVAWELPDVGSLNAMSAFDIDGDGNDELVLAGHVEPQLRFLDARTGQTSASAKTAGEVLSVAVGELDGQPPAEVIIGMETRFQPVSMAVLSGGQLSTRLTLEHGWGNLSRIARGDIDADGEEEFVIASGIQGGIVRVVDAATRQVEWTSPPPSTTADLFYLQYWDVLLAQLDEDAALEIVLVGDHGYRQGRVLVLDGATHEVELRVDASVLDTENPLDAELFDFDGDGRMDLLLASNSVAGGSILHAISLQDGRSLWQSPTMGVPLQPMKRVLTLQSDADAALELVAAMPTGLRAYDAVTGALDWSYDLPVTTAAVHITSSGSAEILIAHGTTLTRLDAATRTILATYDLDAEIDAIDALPGESQWVLLAMNARLHRFDLSAGAVDASTQPLGTGLAEQGHMAVAAGPYGWSVASGSDIGHFEHWLADTNAVFISGFE
jgi:hypothetical protein